MSERITAAIAANRFGLGARPGELGRIGREGPDWLLAQLAGPAPALADPGLESSARTLERIFRLRRELRAARRGDRGAVGGGTLKRLPELIRSIYRAETEARVRQSMATERPLIERLTQFWSNHFAVSVDKGPLGALAGSYEREAVRPHVLGRFDDLLLATQRHPAMLLYLDNELSMGPNSRLARRIARRNPTRKAGINENLARETLELHTVSVDGGYRQRDVTAFAEVLSGWSIAGPEADRFGLEPGTFRFVAAMHEPGAQTVMGRRYPEDGYGQGVAVLRDLAGHPSTARFIATKLARHFIADQPPPAAVARIEAAFLRSGGDLPTVYHALIDSPEAWERPLAKYKSPADYLVSVFRGLGLPAVRPPPVGLFQLLGQRIWCPGSPAGWPDRSADWDGASELWKRIEWADALGQRVGPHRDARALAGELLGANLSALTREALARAASASQALALLLVSPEFIRR